MKHAMLPAVAWSLGCLMSVVWLCASEPAPREIDLLSPPPASGPDSAWKYVSEDPQSRLEDVWSFRDGVLICRGTPKGYLSTKRDYTDCVLRLEWRWPPDKKPGNGGVLLRITGPDKIWPRSLEAQLNADSAGDFWGLDGYPLDGPAERRLVVESPQFGRLTNLKKTESLERPAGQWNQYEITLRGDKATLAVNGRVVNEAAGCQVMPGRICLTAEGDEIHFRNVRLTPLDK